MGWGPAPIRLLLAGLLLLFAAAAPAQAPGGLTPVPKIATHVTDLTGTLSAADALRIDDRLSAFERAKGSQVAVLMVPSIGDEPIEDFALRVTDAWQLGRKGVDDGVLFVIAKQQRKIRIHTGRGVQGTLTDAASKRIIAEQVAPAFRSGDFALGISKGVDGILKAIQGEALPPPQAPRTGKLTEGPGISGPDFIWIAFFGVPILAMVLRPFFGRALGAGLTGGVTGGLAWFIFGSLVAAGIVGVIAFLVAVSLGANLLRQGRRGGWSGGSWGGGGWSGGGGGGGGGWSGGGGGFDGGGASGDW